MLALSTVMRAGAPRATSCVASGARAASTAAAAIRKGSRVKVVLLQQLDNLGYKGEEVAVAPGYARNFLVPGRLAVYATEANKAAHKVVLPTAEQRAIALERETNMLRARIGAMKLTFARATNDGTHLYGSVTASDISEALAASTLRKLGVTEAGIRFAAEASGEAEAAGGAAEGAGGARAIKTVGHHVVEIEARPGLWCPLKVVVDSS